MGEGTANLKGIRCAIKLLGRGIDIDNNRIKIIAIKGVEIRIFSYIIMV